jgi:hypothetical protein
VKLYCSLTEPMLRIVTFNQHNSNFNSTWNF